MLLTHLSGFDYHFSNEKLEKFGRPAGYEVFQGDAKDFSLVPLVNQPGTKFEYGVRTPRLLPLFPAPIEHLSFGRRCSSLIRLPREALNPVTDQSRLSRRDHRVRLQSDA